VEWRHRKKRSIGLECGTRQVLVLCCMQDLRQRLFLEMSLFRSWKRERKEGYDAYETSSCLVEGFFCGVVKFMYFHCDHIHMNPFQIFFHAHFSLQYFYNLFNQCSKLTAVRSSETTKKLTRQPIFSKIKRLVVQGKINGLVTQPKIENKLIINSIWPTWLFCFVNVW